MAKRVFQVPTFTPTATGDAASALANGTYMAVKGGSGTQKIDVLEIAVSGQAGSSSPTFLMFARHSTVAITPTGLAAPASDGPADPATAALTAPPVTFTAAATGPQRSASTSDARLMLQINAFGGIFRWVAAPTMQFGILGNTAQLGESSLSAYTGGTVGAIGAHIIYEPY